LLTDPKIASGQFPNTLEFHWYSAEEGGLLGSQAIFQQYAKDKRDVRAMFQQDMTGYVKPGTTGSVGVITDYVDAGLTDFIKKVITAYCSIPYVTTKCGYACSDHASASKAGYPSAFVIESKMEDTSDYIHSTQDTMSTVNFDHVLEHAKMTVGFAYELAFASL
jgi:leucyl aminopeptidase